MRCVATLTSGKGCPREAQPESLLCKRHTAIERRQQARSFYTARLSDEDRQALALAAKLEGVDAEIAVLRVLIRRVATLGDLDAARRGIESLCRVLKARHELDAPSTDRLATSLGRVLDSLGQELEVPL